jgi:hypothetical protein
VISEESEENIMSEERERAVTGEESEENIMSEEGEQ